MTVSNNDHHNQKIFTSRIQKALLHQQTPVWSILTLYFGLGIIGLLLMNKGDLVIFFSEHRSWFLNGFFKFTNYFGEWYIYVIGFVIALLLRHWRAAISVALLSGLVALFSALLKKYFAHPRPKAWLEAQDIFIEYVPDLYINAGNTSFPSGHTFSAFATFCFFAFMVKPPYLKIIFATFAILGGLARVYLSQHFLEDILFGGLLGLLLAMIATAFSKSRG